jgi:hypothetical protein
MPCQHRKVGILPVKCGPHGRLKKGALELEPRRCLCSLFHFEDCSSGVISLGSIVALERVRICFALWTWVPDGFWAGCPPYAGSLARPETIVSGFGEYRELVAVYCSGKFPTWANKGRYCKGNLIGTPTGICRPMVSMYTPSTHGCLSLLPQANPGASMVVHRSLPESHL